MIKRHAAFIAAMMKSSFMQSSMSHDRYYGTNRGSYQKRRKDFSFHALQQVHSTDTLTILKEQSILKGALTIPVAENKASMELLNGR